MIPRTKFVHGAPCILEHQGPLDEISRCGLPSTQHREAQRQDFCSQRETLRRDRERALRASCSFLLFPRFTRCPRSSRRHKGSTGSAPWGTFRKRDRTWGNWSSSLTSPSSGGSGALRKRSRDTRHLTWKSEWRGDRAELLSQRRGPCLKVLLTPRTSRHQRLLPTPTQGKICLITSPTGSLLSLSPKSFFLTNTEPPLSAPHLPAFDVQGLLRCPGPSPSCSFKNLCCPKCLSKKK